MQMQGGSTEVHSFVSVWCNMCRTWQLIIRTLALIFLFPVTVQVLYKCVNRWCKRCEHFNCKETTMAASLLEELHSQTCTCKHCCWSKPDHLVPFLYQLVSHTILFPELRIRELSQGETQNRQERWDLGTLRCYRLCTHPAESLDSSKVSDCFWRAEELLQHWKRANLQFKPTLAKSGTFPLHYKPCFPSSTWDCRLELMTGDIAKVDHCMSCLIPHHLSKPTSQPIGISQAEATSY